MEVSNCPIQVKICIRYHHSVANVTVQKTTMVQIYADLSSEKCQRLKTRATHSTCVAVGALHGIIGSRVDILTKDEGTYITLDLCVGFHYYSIKDPVLLFYLIIMSTQKTESGPTPKWQCSTP